MLISHSHSFIFVAVPKTGTSSVEQALAPYADRTAAQAFNKHVLAMKLIELIPPDSWASCYKFAFVRNPVDWLFSWYRYRQREELGNPAHRFHHRFTGAISFETFVHTFAESEMFLKQSDFISDQHGEILMDFVGKFENLQDDFSQLCSRLGIAEPALRKLRRSTAISGKERKLSAAGQQIIQDYFRRDFELFNY